MLERIRRNKFTLPAAFLYVIALLFFIQKLENFWSTEHFEKSGIDFGTFGQRAYIVSFYWSPAFQSQTRARSVSFRFCPQAQ